MNGSGMQRAPISSGAGEPSRQPHITAQLEMLGRRVDGLADALNTLRNRLEPVSLVRGQGAGDQSNRPPAEVLAPHAGTLREYNQKLDTMETSVREMIEQLEI